MFFKYTYFHNFRNLSQGRITWSNGFNLLVGPNGAGKTNFIEGLNLVSGWGPMERGAKISDVVRWKDGGGDRASLWARVSGEEEMDIFASISAKCSLKCDDKPIGASGMRNKIPTITFLSDGMSLVKGPASARRALLDRIGAVISPSYGLRLHDYRHALRQKSVLLRKGYDAKIADRVLVPLGAWLWTAREEISKLIYDALAEFSGLLSSPMDLKFVRGGGGEAAGQSEDFRRSIELKREREIASRTPLVGPQRDDLKLICGGRSAADFLSRGQSRRAASALMLASALVIERVTGRKPILMFDEVASELDESGRNVLLDALSGVGYQVFAATADSFEYDGASVYRIKKGGVITG